MGFTHYPQGNLTWKSTSKARKSLFVYCFVLFYSFIHFILLIYFLFFYTYYDYGYDYLL